jgi:tyrosine-protein phosphatase YwqE
MCLFRKHSANLAEVFSGYTDWHCHILPGVDDGIQTMDDALAVLRQYDEWGVSDVWLTPHIMEDIPNTTAALKARFEELKQAYTGSVSLHLAAENMMDNLFEERLAAGDLLPIGPKGDHLLVETSYFNPPMDLWGTIDKIKEKGYKPILAHPERYVYMTYDDYDRLKAKGVLFQMNLFSQAGAYGKFAQKRVKRLREKHYYDISGTDLHRLKMLAAKWPAPIHTI